MFYFLKFKLIGEYFKYDIDGIEKESYFIVSLLNLILMG